MVLGLAPAEVYVNHGSRTAGTVTGEEGDVCWFGFFYTVTVTTFRLGLSA